MLFSELVVGVVGIIFIVGILMVGVMVFVEVVVVVVVVMVVVIMNLCIVYFLRKKVCLMNLVVKVVLEFKNFFLG